MVEVIVTVTIIGILAVISIPQYTKWQEVAKLRDAFTTLQMIRFANESYYLDLDDYGDIDDLTATRYLADPNPDPDWVYTPTVNAGTPPTVDMQAQRSSGTQNGQVIIIDQAGVVAGDHDYLNFAEPS